jgi:hypothetical protein
MKKDEYRGEQQGPSQSRRQPQQQQHDEEDGDENGPTVATNPTTTSIASHNRNAEGGGGGGGGYEEFVNYGTLRFGHNQSFVVVGKSYYNLRFCFVLVVCDYVNDAGLKRWEESRHQWLGGGSGGGGGGGGVHSDGTSVDGGSTGTPRAVAVPLDVDEIIDVIFSPRWTGGTAQEQEQQQQQQQPQDDGTGPPSNTNTNSNNESERHLPRRFPQNVPLPQMVDVLIDLWEAEGLDT